MAIGIGDIFAWFLLIGTVYYFGKKLWQKKQNKKINKKVK